MQVVGERQGSALDPLKPFLKEGFKNPKNFIKMIFGKASARSTDIKNFPSLRHRLEMS